MKQKLPVIFLFITVMLDSMGIGLIMPVMSELIIELDGGNISQAAIWAYCTREQFGWDAVMVGVSLGIFGFSMAVVQSGLIRLIISCFFQPSIHQ